jgi:putative acetyltransferase
MNERPYQPADLLCVVEVYGASIRLLAAPYYTAEQLSAWAGPSIPDGAYWRQRLAPLHTIVAEHDDILVGFGSYEDDGHLDFLFTHPDFARRGVATRLLQRIESAFRSAGVCRIFTEASLAARPFFEHHGFQVDAEELIECRGVQLRRFAMHKQIPNA